MDLELKKKYNKNRRWKYRNDPVYRDKEKARKMADYKPHPVIRFRNERGRFAGSEKVEA